MTHSQTQGAEGAGTKTAGEEPDINEFGRVVWHSSDEDSGPDVGVTVGLGQGRALWFGEISKKMHEEEGVEAAELGDHFGTWIILYDDNKPRGEQATVIGKAIPYVATDVCDAISASLRASVVPAPAATPGVQINRTDVFKFAGQLLAEIDDLIETTDGLAGLHRNGDLATWEELLPEGQYERLSSIEMLRDALAAANTAGATAATPGVPVELVRLSEAATQGEWYAASGMAGQVANGQPEARLRDEVAYWRADLSARIWSMRALYIAARDKGEQDRAIDLRNSLRSALQAFHDAEAGEWHQRCDICGEFVPPGEAQAASEDVSGHARCLSEDGVGSVHPHGRADLLQQVRQAQATLDEPWPTAPDSTRTGAAETEGREIPRRPSSEMMDAGLYQASADATYADVWSIWQAMWDRAASPTVEPALAARPEAPSDAGWRDISTAPKDGSKFDAWAVDPLTGTFGVRFTDVQMRGDGSGFGVVIHRPDAHWEYLEQEGPTFPDWKLTHWRRAPTPPSTLDPAPSGQAEG